MLSPLQEYESQFPGDKMVWTCVDYALHQLTEIQAFKDELDCEFDRDLYLEVRLIWCKIRLGMLERDYDPFERNPDTDECWKEAYTQIQSCKREIMFLKMIIWCSATWDDDDADVNLRSKLTILEDLWEDLGDRIDDNILLKTEPGKQDWDLLVSLLEGTIQQSKLLMVHYHRALLHSSFQSKPLPSDQMFQFLQLVLHNLEVLIPLMKKQTDILKARLILSKSFFQFMTAHEGVDCKELRALTLCFQTFANEVASLFFLFWVNSEKENVTFESKLHQMLSDMHQNIIKPCGNDAIAVYFVALKAIKLQPSDDPFLYEQVVVGLVNLHLDGLVTASKGDLRIVREGLIFLLSFQSSPPGGCNQDEQLALISHQIDLLFGKCTYLILSPHLIIKDKMLLNDFAEELTETKDKVEQLYGKVPDSTFPRTNGLGFYYLLLQNLERLKEKIYSDTSFIPFAKNSIVKIAEELFSLSPLVIGTFELQKEEMEFEETLSQLINLAYRTEHLVNSCSVPIHPIWYNMASLSVILDQIHDVKGKLEMVCAKRKLEEAGNCRIHDTSILSTSLQSTSATIESGRFPLNSEEEGIILKEETSKIMDELTRGHESLSIISIIGMGGLGKSTLAKAVCNSEKVRHHFHKVAWGSVSQVLDKKNFFAEILSGINNCTKDEFDTMMEDDLAHHLWRCLSGRMYLIVVDDVWESKAWDAVKSSFPDDKNRSRIIFTTRELKVAVDVRSSCHNLRPLFDDESFKLLHMKVFGKNDCPAFASELGKVIARNCKGLPLSVVVVAGLLAGNRTSPSWWKEIAEATCQFVGKECKHIIGYSYKHLPEHLKSCFLYMGIYGEDQLIKTKQLRQLWIGEGFVNKSTTKSLRIMAKDQLRDLVDRNLITAVDSTVGGEIRTCRLHDLIGDFCRKQAEEDNFLWLRDRFDAFNFSNSTTRSLFRISMRRSFDDVEPTTFETIHSLLSWHEIGVRKFVVEKLKLVQVMHLEGDTGSKFPNHLVHLRYLSVRSWHGEVIEESICNLWNLETFIVRTSVHPLKLPKTIWKMKMLRHLQFPKGCVFELEDDENEECQQSLDNLEFLSKLLLYDNTIARAVLQRLPNIQKLNCYLIGSGWAGKVFTTDFLRNLESLSLQAFLDDPHFSFPLTLKRLDIMTWKHVSEDVLAAVGKLPCLEVLKLAGYLKRWEVEDGKFQKLKCLWLCLRGFEEWNVSFDSFYCLERLSFRNIHSLMEIPAFFAECPTLQRIETIGCCEELLNLAIQILQEQKDNGNEVQHFYSYLIEKSGTLISNTVSIP